MAAKWGTDSRKTHITARGVLLAGAMACCAPAYAQSDDEEAAEAAEAVASEEAVQSEPERMTLDEALSVYRQRIERLE